MVTSAPSFRLFRFFAIASVLAVSVATSVVGWVVAGAARDDLVDEGRAFAVRIVAHIEAQLADAGLTATLEPSGRTLTAAERAALDRAVRSAIAGLGTLRVNIFDLDGRTIYTTGARPIDPGRINIGAAYKRARGGETVAKLTNSVHHEESAGPVETFALETYVPSLDADGRIRVVIEVYQDAHHLVSGIRTAALRVAALSLASMLATVAVLFVVFLRGDRTIRERTRELRSANRALEDLTAKLEAEVADRTTKLLAQERLALLGTVATGLAHEVNNPLAAIATASEALMRRGERSGAPDPTAKEYLEIIRDEAFRAKAITRDLLDFARREDAQSDAPVDVNEVVRGVAALLKLRPRRDGATVTLALAPDEALPRVVGRAGKLRQAIFNVTDNALDALGPGGGTVAWTTSLEEGPRGPEVVLRCTDDGAGMSEEVRARAFEPFFTTKEPGQGTGLGLSISWGIVESHRGTISLESGGRGRGTTVTIRLPVASQPATRAEHMLDRSVVTSAAGGAS